MNDNNDTPNPKKHKQISLVKSVIRIIAGIMFCYSEIALGGFLLILAEGLGIAEEMV
jgi:hypothetical protein